MQAPVEPPNGNTYPSGNGTPPQPSGGPQGNGSGTPSNPSPPPGGTDWTSDPIYQLVVAQENLAISQAKAAALTAETQALIAYGDYNLALAVTGDKNIALAAQANKGSTLAQLIATNKQNVLNTNENENKNNLFYSSDRGYQLGLAQQAYLTNSSNALAGVQGQMGSISAQLLAQEQAAYQAEQQAAAEAYQRALQNPTGSPAATGTTPPPTKPTPTTTGGGPPVAPGTPPPKGKTNPYATPVTPNPTGGSANQQQGIFSIH